MYANSTYTGTRNGHAVEIDFDTRRVVINKVVLRVDGQEVDSTKVWYGEKDLSVTLDDGTSIEVSVHSGMVGEMTKAQLKNDDGSWVDLTPAAAKD